MERCKKVSLCGVMILFCVSSLTAQSPNVLWTKTYGGVKSDKGYSVQQTSDGGYIFVGTTYSFGLGGDVYLLKTDINGDTLWTKTYGGKNLEEAYSVEQTSDGGYIFVGTTYSFGIGGDVYLIKTDSKGNTLWTKTYGGKNSEEARSVQQTSGGDYIIAGQTSSFGAGGNDIYLIKTDINGDTLWTKTYGGMWDDRGFSVEQTSDGGYIIAGQTSSFGAGGNDIYLTKTDAKGDTLWTKTHGGMWDDRSFSVEQTSDGGYIIAGSTESFGTGGLNVYLIKTDPKGDAIWTKTYGGIRHDRGFSVEQTSDGGYIIAGVTASFGAGAHDVYLIRTDTHGDSLWAKTYGGTDSDEGHSVQRTSDGGYIIAGCARSFGAGDYDVYIIKIKITREPIIEPEQAIELLIDEVETLVATRVLNKGRGNALIKKLEGALQKLNKGHENAAINQLHAFINQVNAFINAGILTVECGQPLIDSANDIINELREIDSRGGGQTAGIITNPSDFLLYQNYPNPFDSKTNITFCLNKASHVSLKIYSATGQLIRTLINDVRMPAYYTVQWDGRDHDGRKVTPSFYFYKIQAEDFTEAKKMILLR